MTQTNISVAVKENSTNNEKATATEVYNGLNKFGYAATLKAYPLTVNETRNCLINGKGILAGYHNPKGGGHMVAISGHDNESNLLEFMDPAIKAKKYVLFDYFRNSAEYFWQSSIY